MAIVLEAGLVQDLVGVDGADALDVGLVHEEQLERRRGLASSRPKSIQVRLSSSGSNALSVSPAAAAASAVGTTPVIAPGGSSVSDRWIAPPIVKVTTRWVPAAAGSFAVSRCSDALPCACRIQVSSSSRSRKIVVPRRRTASILRPSSAFTKSGRVRWKGLISAVVSTCTSLTRLPTTSFSRSLRRTSTSGSSSTVGPPTCHDSPGWDPSRYRPARRTPTPRVPTGRSDGSATGAIRTVGSSVRWR
jgi:hypothetical protein